MTEVDKPNDQPPSKPRSRLSRFGFMNGQCKIPDDFDTLFQAESEEMFCGSIIEPPIDDEGPAAAESPYKP